MPKAKRSPGPDPLLTAFIETAGRLAGDGRTVSTTALGAACLLACLRRAELDSLADAGLLSATSTEQRWDQAAELGCPLLDPSLDGGGRAGRPEVARRAASLAELPGQALSAGALYPQLLEFQLVRQSKTGKIHGRLRRDLRRRSGAFFTPAWMADRLVQLAFGSQPGARPTKLPARPRVLDPACGDGRLLLACAERLLADSGPDPDRRAAQARRLVAEQLRGIDRDPIAVALARGALWRLCDPGRGPVAGLERAVLAGDAIGGPLSGGRLTKDAVRWEQDFAETCGPDGSGFDLLVANPPFEVLTGFARRNGLKQYTERIRRSGYEFALTGNLNTYRLFLERALALLAEGGRLAFVLPFGFLMDRTAAPLRAHLLRSGWVERIEVFPESAHAFEAVGQSVILLAAAKRDRPGRFVEVTDGAGRRPTHRVGLDQLESLDPEGLVLPIAPADAIALAQRMRALNHGCLGELAEGRVGELDQTKYRDCMRSKPTERLLVRGAHLAPFRVELDPSLSEQRWVDAERFFDRRGGGRWREDLEQPRLAQTGIVNLEAARRLVAAEVPAGVVLGNSVNYWAPASQANLSGAALEPASLRAYLLGLLNSTPLEWRFRLTSSNNNVNLYEIRTLPLPRLTRLVPAESLAGYLDRTDELIRRSSSSPLGLVRQITAGWGAPGRADRAAALLIGRVARMLAEGPRPDRARWLTHVADHLVNWHLGLDEPDLERMLQDVPARAWKEDR